MSDKPLTEAVLMKTTHSDLADKLREANGKPLMVTVTYLVDKELEHWIATNNDFPTDDILPSCLALAEDAQKNLMPKNRQHTNAIKEQLRANRKPVAERP